MLFHLSPSDKHRKEHCPSNSHRIIEIRNNLKRRNCRKTRGHQQLCTIGNDALHHARGGVEQACCTAWLYAELDAVTAGEYTIGAGADAVDFALTAECRKGDIVVTQDYGLAAMCLARKAVPLSQNGLVFTDKNIEELLFSRYVSKKIRNAGGRLKGPSKRTSEQDKKFEETLRFLIKQ